MTVIPLCYNVVVKAYDCYLRNSSIMDYHSDGFVLNSVVQMAVAASFMIDERIKAFAVPMALASDL